MLTTTQQWWHWYIMMNISSPDNQYINRFIMPLIFILLSLFFIGAILMYISSFKINTVLLMWCHLNTNKHRVNVDDDIYIKWSSMTTILVRKSKFKEWWIDWYIGCLQNLCSSWYINVIIVVCCCLSEDSKKYFCSGKYSFSYTKDP